MLIKTDQRRRATRRLRLAGSPDAPTASVRTPQSVVRSDQTSDTRSVIAHTYRIAGQVGRHHHSGVRFESQRVHSPLHGRFRTPPGDCIYSSGLDLHSAPTFLSCPWQRGIAAHVRRRQGSSNAARSFNVGRRASENNARTAAGRGVQLNRAPAALA